MIASCLHALALGACCTLHVQDQPIADLLCPYSGSCTHSLRHPTAWEASQNDQGKIRRYEPKELSKAMFLDTAGSDSSLAHISAAQAQRLGSSRCLGGLAVEQTRLEGKKF